MRWIVIKNDNGFVCKHCGRDVSPLGYTSRDHCPYCIYSIHIDNMPGDRANKCLGLLRPVSVEPSNKKGYIVTYRCEKCGEIKRNKSAEDDDFDELLRIQKENANGMR